MQDYSLTEDGHEVMDSDKDINESQNPELDAQEQQAAPAEAAVDAAIEAAADAAADAADSAAADGTASAASGGVEGAAAGSDGEKIPDAEAEVVNLGSDSLLEIADDQDVMSLSDEELARFARRPVSFEGFRLERVDVYNWGSFNNNVKSVYFGGQNVLMTGDNGAGKSSIIDAITVLLYDVKKVTFNQAAGAEKGERSLSSYVLGLYKNDNSSGVKTEMGLRSRDKAVLTVLMATFYNKALNEYVVLVQCMVIARPKNTPSRYYFIGNRDFNLQNDVLPVKDIRDLGRRLSALGAQRYDSFSQYYSQMQRLFGIENTKVLDLFYKTISMKSINNISDFVRNQMLEDFNGDELVDQMVERFNDLDASYRSVEEARKQVQALEPIVVKGEEYKNIRTQKDFLNRCSDGVGPYLYKKKAELITEEIERNNRRISELEAEAAHTAEQIESISAHMMSTTQEMSQHGGNRREMLVQSINHEKSSRERVFRNYNVMATFITTLDLNPVTDERSFKSMMSSLSTLSDKFASSIQSYEESITSRNVELKQESSRLLEINDELRSLRGRKSNLPSRHIEVRNRIAAHIGCKDTDLPFAGELMQIRADEKARWELAIEKVLHGFALSMLVPEEHYAEVASFVNSNNIGMRLVFYRIREADASTSAAASTTMGSVFGRQLNGFGMRSGSETLPRKIEIKNDPVFQGFLRNHLEKNFNYVCTEDMTEFRQERMALTPSGLSKVGGRNEKDDRRSQHGNDFILGWSNEEKILFLQNEYTRCNTMVSTIEETIKGLRSDMSTIANKQQMIARLSEIQGYEYVDYMSIDATIERLQADLDEINRSNDIVATLTHKLEEYRQDKKNLEDRLSNCQRELGQLQSRNEMHMNEHRHALDLSISAQYLSAEIINAINHLVEKAQERLKYTTLTYDRVEHLVSEIVSVLKHESASLTVRENALAQELVNLQSRFTQSFVVAGRNLDASRAAAWEDFRDFLDKLMRDDLPRFVDAFKDKLNRETIDQLGTLNAALITQCRKIKERISDINSIMKDVDFNPDHYIQMEARESPDNEIKQFRIDLRSCTTQEQVEGEEEEGSSALERAEQRFYKVKALIDRFKGEVNGAEIDRRWRNKVTDVKQWFDFAASEHTREDDSQVDYYEDSGGKSGGQKEKLAYTVLASSIAYQYRSKARRQGGIEVNEALDRAQMESASGNDENAAAAEAAALAAQQNQSCNSSDRSYRFVIIDEAFGRGSPQSVDYALTLFSKFNLQLLVATPMQKLDIIEKYVNHVAFVYRDEDSHESTVLNYELDDYIVKRRLKEQIARPAILNRKIEGDPLSGLSPEEATRLYNELDERIISEQDRFAGPRVNPERPATASASSANDGASGGAGAADSTYGSASGSDAQPAPKAGSRRRKAAASAEAEAAAAAADAASSSAADAAAEGTGSAGAEAATGDASEVGACGNAQSAAESSTDSEAESAAEGAADSVPEENVENKEDHMHLKGDDGKYLDPEVYASRLKEERKLNEARRTDEALSRLDFLDSLYSTPGDVDSVVDISIDDSRGYDAAKGTSEDGDQVFMYDLEPEFNEERASAKKGKKKAKEEEEEPHYEHSLDELVIEDDDEDDL